MSHPQVLIAADSRELLRDLIPEFPRTRFVPMAGMSGQHAVEVLRQRSVDAVVIHERLADMKGRELCKWLRDNIGDSLTIVLLVKKLPRRRRGSPPWDAALRFPAGPGVIGDRVQNLVRQKWAEGGGLDEFGQEVARRVEALDAQDYYKILGLSRQARHDKIRDAYDALSLRFHPDKYLTLKGTPTHDQLTELYKRIGEAYRVLTDNKKKKAYDKGLKQGTLRLDDSAREAEGPKSLEELSDNPRVKRFLKLAQVSVASGNTRAALQNLKFARSLESDNELLAEKIAELEGS